MVTNRSLLTTITIMMLIMSSFVPHSFAKTMEAKGLEVAKIVKSAGEGFVGETSVMKMILIDAYGSKITRLMEGKTLERSNEGDYGLIIFQNPLDVKGTKMLTHTYKSKDDDQWLYLPSIRKVKRISSRNKTSAFMGSEFSYEDLGSQEIEKYKHKLLREEKLNSKDVWVLERTPLNESGYSRQVSYLDKKTKTALKVEYFDKRNELLKIATFKDIKSFDVKGKKLYRASEIHMKNIQTQKESIFSWDQRKLGVKLSQREFKSRALKK